MLNDPAGSRMPPPNRLVFVSGFLIALVGLVIVVVLVAVVSAVRVQLGGLWFFVFLWGAVAAWGAWRSPFGRSVRRQIRAFPLRSDVPAVVALHEKWCAKDIAAREVATRAEIAAFEEQTGMTLPTDLRHYFTLVNGTTPLDWGRDDGYGVSFLPLNGVSSFADSHVGTGPDAERTFAFARWSVSDAVYGVRLSDDPSEATPVFASMPSGRVQVAASFSEFVERYLWDPRSVLAPEFDVVAAPEGIGTERDGLFTCSVRWEDVRAISIEFFSRDDRTVQALWVIKSDKPMSSIQALCLPVVLSARATELTKRLRAFPGFDEDAFRAAVAAEQRDEAGTFMCWRHPDFKEKPSAMTV